MKEIQKTRTEEIVTLHNEIVGHLRSSLEKAMRIGELLTEQKESLKHGEFIPWIEDNLPFTDRTARNYMRLFRERDRIKTETVSDLTSAYGLLKADHEENPDWNPDEWLQIIEYINTTFFHHPKKHRINTELGVLYEYLTKRDDGSMTEREIRGFCLWANWAGHLCYWTNLSQSCGKDNLPPRIRRYLDASWEDTPDWENRVKIRICKKFCQQGFNESDRPPCGETLELFPANGKEGQNI